jgi:hypothetical protein
VIPGVGLDAHHPPRLVFVENHLVSQLRLKLLARHLPSTILVTQRADTLPRRGILRNSSSRGERGGDGATGSSCPKSFQLLARIQRRRLQQQVARLALRQGFCFRSALCADVQAAGALFHRIGEGAGTTGQAYWHTRRVIHQTGKRRGSLMLNVSSSSSSSDGSRESPFRHRGWSVYLCRDARVNGGIYRRNSRFVYGSHRRFVKWKKFFCFCLNTIVRQYELSLFTLGRWFGDNALVFGCEDGVLRLRQMPVACFCRGQIKVLREGWNAPALRGRFGFRRLPSPMFIAFRGVPAVAHSGRSSHRPSRKKSGLNRLSLGARTCLILHITKQFHNAIIAQFLRCAEVVG